MSLRTDKLKTNSCSVIQARIRDSHTLDIYNRSTLNNKNLNHTSKKDTNISSLKILITALLALMLLVCIVLELIFTIRSHLSYYSLFFLSGISVISMLGAMVYRYFKHKNKSVHIDKITTNVTAILDNHGDSNIINVLKNEKIHAQIECLCKHLYQTERFEDHLTDIVKTSLNTMKRSANKITNNLKNKIQNTLNNSNNKLILDNSDIPSCEIRSLSNILHQINQKEILECVNERDKCASSYLKLLAIREFSVMSNISILVNIANESSNPRSTNLDIYNQIIHALDDLHATFVEYRFAANKSNNINMDAVRLLKIRKLRVFDILQENPIIIRKIYATLSILRLQIQNKDHANRLFSRNTPINNKDLCETQIAVDSFAIKRLSDHFVKAMKEMLNIFKNLAKH